MLFAHCTISEKIISTFDVTIKYTEARTQRYIIMFIQYSHRGIIFTKCKYVRIKEREDERELRKKKER